MGLTVKTAIRDSSSKSESLGSIPGSGSWLLFLDKVACGGQWS